MQLRTLEIVHLISANQPIVGHHPLFLLTIPLRFPLPENTDTDNVHTYQLPYEMNQVPYDHYQRVWRYASIVYHIVFTVNMCNIILFYILHYPDRRRKLENRGFINYLLFFRGNSCFLMFCTYFCLDSIYKLMC